MANAVFNYSIFMEIDEETFLVRASCEAEALYKLLNYFREEKREAQLDEVFNLVDLTHVMWNTETHLLEVSFQSDVDELCAMLECEINKVDEARDVIRLN